MKTKQFQGTCVENPFERIETLVNVVENAVAITKQTFFKHCFVHPEIAAQMRQYPDDYEFYKWQSIYFHSVVYFYTQSAIEHFYW